MPKMERDVRFEGSILQTRGNGHATAPSKESVCKHTCLLPASVASDRREYPTATDLDGLGGRS
nr:MAG TPA: hypothetical protein [Caudoviricetes sp.]